MICQLSIKTYKSELNTTIFISFGVIVVVTLITFFLNKTINQSDFLENFMMKLFQILSIIIILFSIHQLSKALIQLFFFNKRIISSNLEVDLNTNNLRINTPLLYSSNNCQISTKNIKSIIFTSKDGFIEMEINSALPRSYKTDLFIKYLKLFLKGNDTYKTIAYINPFNKTKLTNIIKNEFPSIEIS